MKKNPLRDKLVMTLDDMKAKAVEMGIEGVATASVLDRNETDDWIGEMKVVGTPCNEKEGWTIVDTEDVLGVNLNIKPKR